jgi:hypothetical protein
MFEGEVHFEVVPQARLCMPEGEPNHAITTVEK